MIRRLERQASKPGALSRAGLFVFWVLAAPAPGLPSAGAAPAPKPTKPDVLLITIDTLRPDALGWVGGANRTPALDALAASGLALPGAFSPAPLTLPSHVSILSGLEPRRHGVHANGQLVPAAGVPWLPERLRSAGYATAAFVSGFPLAATFGTDRGFDRFDDRFDRGTGDRLERAAADTVDAAVAWLAGAPAAPNFVWVHFYDPHDPYQPEPGGASDARSAYLAEVRRVDAAIARLLAAWRHGRSDLLVVLAADHGESLGEHGEATHGFFVYQSTTTVPAVISWPGRVTPRRSSAAARLVDLAPTVLDLLGLGATAGTDGVSLAPLTRGEPMRLPAAFLESRLPFDSYGWAPLSAVVEGGFKLVVAPKPELYDLGADPSELANRYDSDRPRARRLAALAPAGAGEREAAPAVRDEETIRRLRALGYIGDAAADSSTALEIANRPDPKDRVDVWNALGEAERLLEEGKPTDAAALFDRALARDPDNPFALARSAEALVAKGELTEAIARLRRAAGRVPRSAEVRRSLAEALERAGRPAESAAEWAALAALQPRDARAWLGLGSALGRAGRAADAVVAFERAAALAPEDPDYRLRLAFAAAGAGDFGRAADELLRAAAKTTSGGFAHSCALTVVLDRAGRAAEMEVWSPRCGRSEPEFAEARYREARRLASAGRPKPARRALDEAIAAAPALADQARKDPILVGLLVRP